MNGTQWIIWGFSLTAAGVLLLVPGNILLWQWMKRGKRR